MSYRIDRGELAYTRIDCGEIADGKGTARTSRCIWGQTRRSLLFTKVKTPLDELWQGLSTDVDTRLLEKVGRLCAILSPEFEDDL